MGYKKAFNLVIMQLIMPLASMTKAEYKDAYGIDLDDVDIEKVTLIQKEGSKQKYFVDQIKETEDGFDIYAGGNILSIGDDGNVSVALNAYSVENSKPIYCHPIRFTWKDNAEPNVEWGEITCLIFNNDSTPFTLTTFKTYIDALRESAGDNVSILANGAFQTAASAYSDGKTSIATRLYEVTQNLLQLSGKRLDGSPDNNIVTSWSTIADNIINFSDGVNKIN